MSASNNIHAYPDAQEILDKALSAEKGITVKNLATIGAARHLAQRLNKFRALDRKRNLEVFGADDPRGKGSVYDALVVRVDTETLSVVVTPRQTSGLVIEEIE